jgi:hypothetical protein
VLAEVGQLDFGQKRRRGRDEYLTAVSCGGDACSTVDVLADVALLSEKGRAGVDPHSHTHGAVRGEAFGDLGGGRECFRRGREREEEGVSLGVDLHPAVAGTKLP